MIRGLFILFFSAFMPLLVSAYCTPKPDMVGNYTIQKCNLDPMKHGVVLEGVFVKSKIIPGRQTQLEPFYKKSEKPAEVEFRLLPGKTDLELFFKTSSKNICKKNLGVTYSNLRVFFFCCEKRLTAPSKCPIPTFYYTEDIENGGPNHK